MQVPPISVIVTLNNVKFDLMPIEESIREMEGKISILDNRKFIGLVGLLSVYAIAYLSFLTHLIIQSGGF
jgi:hypothetical protein